MQGRLYLFFSAIKSILKFVFWLVFLFVVLMIIIWVLGKIHPVFEIGIDGFLADKFRSFENFINEL